MSEPMDLDSRARAVQARVPLDAAAMLAKESPETVAAILERLPVKFARLVNEHLPRHLQTTDPLTTTTELEIPGTVSELMEPLDGVLLQDQSVADAIAYLRQAADARQITYLYVTDDQARLVGMIVIRDLLLSAPEQTLAQVMLPDPFCFRQDESASEAIQEAVHRHYPVYPVCDGAGRPVGIVRGWRLFERQAVEITAQSGRMVGVDSEERIYTSLARSFRMRHPWLQVNLLTAFGTAFVVGLFEDTISKIVLLAAFLPVLSCLAGNNGCQALAITIRGLTLGDFNACSVRQLLLKEVGVGALNGFFTGLVGALAIYLFARTTGADHAGMLAAVMLLAMVGACIISCLLGTLVPLGLKRCGADPATASSIFVLTVTDITGMALMLQLASVLVL